MDKTVWWKAGAYAGLTVATPSDTATVTLEIDASSPIELGSTVWVLPKLDGKTTSMALSVNGVPGGNATFGTIDEQNGFYVAPSIMPPGGMVVLMATTRTEPALSGSVALTFKAAAVGARPPGVPEQVAAIRLLEQTTFGPTSAEIARLRRMGALPWLQEQFALRASAAPSGSHPDTVRRNWYQNMVNGQDQLRQRMIFALSQIFVAPSGPDPYGDGIQSWLATLSNNAFGSYKTLLLNMTLNLATAGQRGAAGKPAAVLHEEHAREVMESFAVGPVMLNQDGTVRLDRNGAPIPTDDEAIVAELAQALAGCTYLGDGAGKGDNPGATTILNGVRLPADLDAAIDMLFKHPNVPPFVATCLIRHFVTSKPSRGYVRRVAEAFAFGMGGQGERGDLKATLMAVLTDPEARNDSITPRLEMVAVEDAGYADFSQV